MLKQAVQMQGSWASRKGTVRGFRHGGRLKGAIKFPIEGVQGSNGDAWCMVAGRPGLSGGVPKASDPPQRLTQRPRQMGPLAWLQSRLQPGRQQAMSRSDYVRIDFRAPRCASCLPLLLQAMILQ